MLARTPLALCLLLAAASAACAPSAGAGRDAGVVADLETAPRWHQRCRYPVAGPVFARNLSLIGGQTRYIPFDPADPESRLGDSLPSLPGGCAEALLRDSLVCDAIGARLAHSPVAFGWVFSPLVTPSALGGYCWREPSVNPGCCDRKQCPRLEIDPLSGVGYQRSLSLLSDFDKSGREQWALVLGDDQPRGPQSCWLWRLPTSVELTTEVGRGEIQRCEIGAARSMATAVALLDHAGRPDGRALIAGGLRQGQALGELRLIDVREASVEDRVLPYRLAEPRYGHSLTALPGGKVLVAGGAHPQAGVEALRESLELIDVAAGTVTLLQQVGFAAVQHGAIALPGERVLLVGGSDSTQPELPTMTHRAFGQALLFSAPSTIERLPDLPEPRYAFELLVEDRAGAAPSVLVIGGYGPGKSLAEHIWRLELGR